MLSDLILQVRFNELILLIPNNSVKTETIAAENSAVKLILLKIQRAVNSRKPDAHGQERERSGGRRTLINDTDSPPRTSPLPQHHSSHGRE